MELVSKLVDPLLSLARPVGRDLEGSAQRLVCLEGAVGKVPAASVVVSILSNNLSSDSWMLIGKRLLRA